MSDFAENTPCKKKITSLSDGSISKLFPTMVPDTAGKLKYTNKVYGRIRGFPEFKRIICTKKV
jgi:hypothetical protein